MENPVTPNPENNFFELSLSAQGAQLFKRVYRINRWLFILGIVASVIALVNIGIRFRLHDGTALFQGDWMSILTSLFPFFEVASVIITVVQLYCFFTFTRIGNKGIELQQSEQFNESFKWLFRETMLAAIMFVLQTIMLSIATLLNFKLLVNMH